MDFEEFYQKITEGVYGEPRSIEDTDRLIGRCIVYHFFKGYSIQESVDYINENKEAILAQQKEEDEA